MNKAISPPTGLTDAEESEWWYEHRDAVSAEVGQGFTEGRMKRRTPAELERGVEARRSTANQRPAFIQLEAADAAKAQSLADRKGISYQTYVQMLVHEALEKERDAA